MGRCWVVLTTAKGRVLHCRHGGWLSALTRNVRPGDTWECEWGLAW